MPGELVVGAAGGREEQGVLGGVGREGGRMGGGGDW